MIIFCSGTMDMSYEVMNIFKNEKVRNEISLSEIAKLVFLKQHDNYLEPSLEIMLIVKRNDIIRNFQISHYNDFDIKNNIVNEGVGVFTGGVKTQESLDYLCDKINKKGQISVRNDFIELFEYLSCESIGGRVIGYEVDDSPKPLLDEVLKEENISYVVEENKFMHEELVIAEMVLGKLILTQKISIGDPDGLWVTQGPTTTITDRCGREVVKLGLIEKNPDKFGLIFNNYASANCSDTTIVNRVGMDGASGFFIQQRSGSTFVNRLWTDIEGTLNAQNLKIKDSIIADGSMTIGSGSSVFKVDAEGLRLGSESMSNAPFRVTPAGIMYAKGGEFRDGQLIVGSGSNVIIIDQRGITVGGEDINTSPAAIYIDGHARFTNLLLTKPDGTFLANTENGKFDLFGWDLQGVGAIDAQLISAKIVSSVEGYISDLVAARLSTLTNAAIDNWSNYIRIEGNEAKWITGKAISQSSQKSLSDGRLLYWVDASQTGQMTVDETPWPVYEYTMEEKIKARLTFIGSGEAAYPSFIYGEGDANGFGRGYINKPNTTFDLIYTASNTGRERSLKLHDNGINLYVDGNDITQMARNITIAADQGYIKISNSGGASITLNPNGSITFSGTRYDFL